MCKGVKNESLDQERKQLYLLGKYELEEGECFE